MLKRLILGLVLVGACGSAGETGQCAQRAGTYRFSYAFISGDCGAGPVGDVSTIDAQPPASASERYSADNCEVTIVDSTSTTADGYTVTLNGKIEWNQDGSHGSGPITIDESSLDGTCHGSYQITSDRI
jgi:hypothetical protein